MLAEKRLFALKQISEEICSEEGQGVPVTLQKHTSDEMIKSTIAMCKHPEAPDCRLHLVNPLDTSSKK
jgi:hypothetical protein